MASIRGYRKIDTAKYTTYPPKLRRLKYYVFFSDRKYLKYDWQLRILKKIGRYSINYNLPTWKQAKIVKTEVKRVGSFKEEEKAHRTRYY